MKPIFNAPEIILLVFQFCNTVEDGLSLASTCRFLATIWRTHATTILHTLIKTQTPGFDQALLAVRATNLIRNACEAKASPRSPFPLHQLGVRARKPSIGELKQVRDLQHFARCIEHMYSRGKYPNQMHRLEDRGDIPEEERIRMSCRFHCAVYRVLFAGAVLAPAYLEPLFLAPAEGPPGFLRRLSDLRVDLAQNLDGLIQADIEYLERFPVYDLEAGQEMWEPAFGHLASRLFDDIENIFAKTETEEASKYSLQNISAGELARLQEITFFLAAYQHIMDKLFNTTRFQPLHPAADVFDIDIDISYMGPPLPPYIPGGKRKVTIVMFGMFRPEVVSMPETVEHSSRCYLVNEPLVPKEQWAPANQDGQVADYVSPCAVDIRWVLEIVHKRSGRPNLRNGCPSPPPPLRFIEFVLAKDFKTKFKDGLFDRVPSAYYKQNYLVGFLENANLFRDDSIRFTTWLFTENEPPTLGYRPLP